MTDTIAFIGLGNMGRPMAANLVTAGYEVVGYDPAPAGVEGAAAVGVVPAASAAHAAADAGIVLSMLPSGLPATPNRW